MPFYAITGLRSHRHPFYGDALDEFGADTVAATGSTTGSTPAAGAASTAKPTTPEFTVLSPIVAGAISGLVAYSVSREVGVDAPKSVNLGIVMGLLSAIGQIAGVWLHNRLAALPPIKLMS